MNEKSFIDWVEQQPEKDMGLNELLKKFEKIYYQLSLVERRLLDTKNAEMFLREIDNVLHHILVLLLGDRNTKGGLINDWREVGGDNDSYG